MEATAVHRRARLSPRKARLVADLVRGREVGEALEILSYTRKKAAPLLRRVVQSAVANAEYRARAEGFPLDIDSLYVKRVLVDDGPRLKRWRPRARGMATRIIKRTCHLTVVVDAAR